MSRKLYSDGGEYAYDLEHWVVESEDRQESITIELQKPYIRAGHMWCTAESELCEKGCTQGCDAYDPCNGKSGRCRFMKNTLIGTGQMFKVHPDGKIEKWKEGGGRDEMQKV